MPSGKALPECPGSELVPNSGLLQNFPYSRAHRFGLELPFYVSVYAAVSIRAAFVSPHPPGLSLFPEYPEWLAQCLAHRHPYILDGEGIN